MANLNFRYLFDHHSKADNGLNDASFITTNPLQRFYTEVCRGLTGGLLYLACVPLLFIRRMPEPLEKHPVVAFHYHQWLEVLDYIQPPHHKVIFAAARVIDSCRLMANYNPVTRRLRKNHPSCHCGECDGRCSDITIRR